MKVMQATEAENFEFLGKSEPVEKQEIITLEDVNIHYGSFHAVKNASLPIYEKTGDRIHWPLGLWKKKHSIEKHQQDERYDQRATIDGKVLFHGHDLYAKDVDPVLIRRSIGMVFQKPNPFPKSIYENITWGAKINGFKGDYDELVETSLQKAALWDEVKDKLKQNALRLSGGQQQRLCIARTWLFSLRSS